MGKFKVGDIVRCSDLHEFRYDQVGEVIRVDETSVEVLFDKVHFGHMTTSFLGDELELIDSVRESIDRVMETHDGTLRKLAEYEAQEKKQGTKADSGKPPVSLTPVEAILGEAEVFAFGAKKYGRHNFRLGFEHTRALDAALRHILAILNGEDLDPESGLPHWAHARCSLAMYAYMVTNNVGQDDRYKREA